MCFHKVKTLIRFRKWFQYEEKDFDPLQTSDYCDNVHMFFIHKLLQVTRKHFFRNSEAHASEFLENIEGMYS